MNKGKIIILALIIALIILVGMFFILRGGSSNPNLTNPTLVSTPSPTPSAPAAPKTFQFDESTDLEVELEKIDPQILDSDFE